MSKTWFISDLHLSHKNILKYEPSRIPMVIAELDKHHYWNDDIPYAFKVREIVQGLADEKKRAMILKIHDDILIRNWNNTVSKNDTVWFLGDFAFGNRDQIRNFVRRLNGHKRMIKGNHDKYSRQFYEEAGFEYVSSYPVVLKGKFILSHSPLDNDVCCDDCGAAMTMHISLPNQFFNIFGHVHLNNSTNIPTHTNRSQCVCVERQDFLPIRIQEYDYYNPNNIQEKE